VEGACY
jgi:hypothetical protein